MSFTLPIVIAFATGFALTPVVRRFAPYCGLLDHPDRHRKLHGRKIPLGGGVAVLCSVVVAVLVTCLFDERLTQSFIASGRQWWMFAAVAGMICVLGLADDRRLLRGRQKIAGQVVAILLLIQSGLLIKNIEILDCRVELGLLAVPFTLCWMLGAINSLNLLDGADGFATTIGIIIAAAIAVMAAIGRHPAEAAVAMAVAGALVAFLIYNFPPASIFLGDAGSMLIGFAVGVLAIRSSLKGPATFALAAPLAVLAIPFFDSTVAILRRWLTGRSLYTTDRGHLHHKLSRRGLGPKGILFIVGLLCAATAAGALISVFMTNELCALVSVGAALGILIVSRIFGFNELVLLTSRAMAFGNSLIKSPSNRDGLIQQESVQLQGSRNWDLVWDSLTGFAEKHNFHKVRLDLNVAWLHEGYHAQWSRSNSDDETDSWHLRFPLVANGRNLGRIEIVASSVGTTVGEALSKVSQLLESLEPCVFGLADELLRDPKDSVAVDERQERSPDQPVFEVLYRAAGPST